MKIEKRYDENGVLVYMQVDLTLEESQPDWIIDAANARKAKERKLKEQAERRKKLKQEKPSQRKGSGQKP